MTRPAEVRVSISPRQLPTFTLERTENPHPRMLAGALARRGRRFRRAGWRGYLAAMCDATGCDAEEIEAWMTRQGAPLYLATASTDACRDAMRRGLLGQMLTQRAGNRLEPDVPWAADNGCFTDEWDSDLWLVFLQTNAQRPGCLFAVVPDVVGDAAATDERWEKWSGYVQAFGYRAAYVTQNGCTAIPPDADVVFTGGDDTWKLGPDARRLAADAKARGLWTHMGRVNSLRRLRYAANCGYDSVDGTFLAFGPDLNLPRMLRYLRTVANESAQRSFDFDGASVGAGRVRNPRP